MFNHVSPLPSRRRREEPSSGGGLDLNSMIQMMAQLYGLSQQQAQGPGQLELQQGQLRHQDLQNQMQEWELQNAPDEARRRGDLASAQIDAYKFRDHIDPAFAFLPPEAQQAEVDRRYPQIAQQHEAASQAKDAAQWPMLLETHKHSKLTPEMRAGLEPHWGAPAMDHLQSLYEGPPAPMPTKLQAGVASAATPFLRMVADLQRRALVAQEKTGMNKQNHSWLNF